MDKRKLTASGNSEELRTMDGNMVATTDNLLVRWPLEEKQAMIRELAHRWNNHNDLLAALKEALRTLVTPQGFPDAKHRTQEQQAAYDQARAAITNATNTH